MSDEIAGTPEDTKLMVKRVGGEWIVENNLGESLGAAEDQAEALEIAQRLAPENLVSVIALHDANGTLERVIDV